MCKFLLLCVFFIGISQANTERQYVRLPKEVVDVIKASLIKCSGPTDNHIDILSEIRQGKYKEDQHFRELIHCSYKNSGFAHPNGRINLPAAISVFPGHKGFEKAMTDCDITGPNPVETTYLSFKCFQDTSPYLYEFGPLYS